MTSDAADSPTRILVADDEDLVRRLLAASLARSNYQVHLAASGQEALSSAMEHNPNLVILDLLLPDINGMEVCRKLRDWRPVPIMIISGRDEETTKIAALDLGADDYLTKPFATGEMLARVRALLRRAAPAAPSKAVALCGPLRIDMQRRRVVRDEQEIRLTRTEFEIVSILAQEANQVVTAKSIIQKVWGLRYVDDTQTLRVHIGHIRKKIEPDPEHPHFILTEQGIGYRFADVRASARQ